MAKKKTAPRTTRPRPPVGPPSKHQDIIEPAKLLQFIAIAGNKMVVFTAEQGKQSKDSNVRVKVYKKVGRTTSGDKDSITVHRSSGKHIKTTYVSSAKLEKAVSAFNKIMTKDAPPKDVVKALNNLLKPPSKKASSANTPRTKKVTGKRNK